MYFRLHASPISLNDASVLEQAAASGARKMGISKKDDLHQLTTIIYSIANSGYARAEDGTFDADEISAAAVRLFLNLHSLPPQLQNALSMSQDRGRLRLVGSADSRDYVASIEECGHHGKKQEARTSSSKPYTYTVVDQVDAQILPVP